MLHAQCRHIVRYCDRVLDAEGAALVPDRHTLCHTLWRNASGQAEACVTPPAPFRMSGPQIRESGTRCARGAQGPHAMLSRMPHVDAHGATVIVADDDDDLRTTVVLALRADGYIVVEARDGEELLALVADTVGDPATRPDVVVADVRMPKLSGLGVLEELRRTHVRLPVLMMTGFAPQSVEVVARRLGAIGVLRKPFDIDDLRMAVMNARTR